VFKIDQSASYWWPVTVEFPVDRTTRKETFDAEFRRLPQSRIREITAQDSTFDAVALAREVLVSWKGIQDDGQDMPYSEAARDRLLDVPLVAGAITSAWFASLTGAKAKN
jgi:hypothetical protein